MPQLERDGQVYLLRLTPDEENRFHPDWLAEVGAALDEVEAAHGPRALVTAGSGKFWSTGLDLDWFGGHPERAAWYLDQVCSLFARTLSASTVTVAAINGHAFGLGAMWSLAHDFRVMRAERGYFCLPEVDLGLEFEPRLATLIRARLTPATAHEAMTTGRRYGGGDALAAGIVEQTASADDLLAAAVARAAELAGKSVPVRTRIKETLYAEVLAALRRPSTSEAAAE